MSQAIPARIRLTEVLSALSLTTDLGSGRGIPDDQRVVRLRHYGDTAKHIASFAGEDTTA